MAIVLAIGFWVRSNWYVDEIWVSLPAERGLGVVSANNCASVAIQRRDGDPADYIVGYSGIKLKELHSPRVRSYLGFGAARDGDLSFVIVPYWFLVAVLASAPWFRWRFSLRTLLVGMTLVAIGLGMVVYGAHR
jgi:hypothetical protein